MEGNSLRLALLISASFDTGGGRRRGTRGTAMRANGLPPGRDKGAGCGKLPLWSCTRGAVQFLFNHYFGLKPGFLLLFLAPR